MSWSNWSGSVRSGAEVQRPRTEDELAAIVRKARTVRPTGAGHSFMPLCASNDAIVSGLSSSAASQVWQSSGESITGIRS